MRFHASHTFVSDVDIHAQSLVFGIKVRNGLLIGK
jgi:hypothetical protein